MALAEAVLFPGIPARELTGDQIAAAAAFGREYLRAIGAWPVSITERNAPRPEAPSRGSATRLHAHASPEE